VEADALSDGREVFIPAIMQQIEMAGVHSGDSACVIPPVTVPQRHLETVNDYTRRIARELGVIGLMNIQYAIAKDTVYVLEANPRASRTVPLVSKVCDIPMATLATQVMLGRRLADLMLQQRTLNHYGVKESVFPFVMFPEVDPVLGPEMRSTGEVLGMAESYGMAFFKSQEAAGQTLPLEGAVLITVSEKDRAGIIEVARRFAELGFTVYATEGTQRFLVEQGVQAELARKLHEGRPNIADQITNGQVQLVINTPIGRLSQHDDSYIRKAAVRYKVPYITTVAAAQAAAEGIAACRRDSRQVKSLQEYHAELT
jgi:carbamoyl-phosphate synthase large subunit